MSQGQNDRTRPTTSVAQMTVKRSVSPDGRINSLSVEITSPFDALDPDEFARRARQIVASEARVIEVFLGSRDGDAALKPNVDGAESTPARITTIGGMDTEWGRRLFLMLKVNGETTRVFGSPRKLAGILVSAGMQIEESKIQEGLELDVPCQVVAGRTEDGRYLAIEKVIPASAA